ncbi:MAG: M24 family metallopeptidase [Patescibacteria group bacterium]
MAWARKDTWRKEAALVEQVLEAAPPIDRHLRIGREEFEARRRKVVAALARRGLDAGVVYCDAHYNGDVPYLGGNTNITIEPVAGVVGPGGFHILAGLEGGYVVEQLAKRSGAIVHKVEMLKLADENYPIEAERVEDVIAAAAGGRPSRIGLLTPRQVLPASFYQFLAGYTGSPDGAGVIDVQEDYYRIKYLKSDAEMRLIGEASKIADVMIRAMLAVLKPDMLETEVAAWGCLVAKELGAEEMGWDVMVTANTANRTLIGKALNRPINRGDMVHIGVAPKCDGLNSCERVSVAAVADPAEVTPAQRYWLDFVGRAFEAGLAAYRRVAAENLPARLQEQALVDYFAARSAEVSARVGRPVDMTRQKPYTGTHNGGYTECQEFYGAITLDSEEPLGGQIVTMLDVAVRGVGDSFDDVIIPDLDYVVVEKTLGKYGPRVEVLNKLPVDVQHLVGHAGGV